MTRKTQVNEEWLTLPQAVRFMTTKHGRPIAPGFITRLALDRKIRIKQPDGRTNLYLKSDLDEYPLRAHTKKEKGTGVA